MNKLPPPPSPAPSSDDEDENASLGALTAAWHEAIEWARRGDFALIVSMLRGETSLPDDWHVRQFLADVVDGTFKRPKGKPVRRPEITFVVDRNGRPRAVNKPVSGREQEIRRWVAENKAQRGKSVIEDAAKHFNVREETITNAVRRSIRSRST